LLGGEIAAAEKRINYLARLGNVDMKVWGDEGWRAIEQYGVKYMGLKKGYINALKSFVMSP